MLLLPSGVRTPCVQPRRLREAAASTQHAACALAPPQPPWRLAAAPLLPPPARRAACRAQYVRRVRRASGGCRASAGGDFAAEPFQPNASRRRRRSPLLEALVAKCVALYNDPLKRRIAATLWLVLCIRAAHFVPLPGFSLAHKRSITNVVDLLVPTDLGDLTVATMGMSVCHMGVSPYITASIVLSFALAAAPELRQWRKDAGAAGQDVIGQLARRVGLGISLVQAVWTAYSIRTLASPALAALSTPTYYALTVLPLAAGTTSLMWMAEEITRTGIGQGTSVVISLSIVGAYASALQVLVPRVLSGAVAPAAVTAVGAAVLLQTAMAVLTVEGVRKVPITFFQLQGGAGGAADAAAASALRDDHIPFRANPTGIQPVLFAVCLLDGVPWALNALGAPSTAMTALSAFLSPDRAFYYALYFAVVFAFSFLDVEDTPAEVAEYILKVGARVPGVRPGDATVAYLRDTQLAARAWGGLLLGLLSTASMLADKWMHAAFGKSVGFTSMLIITGTVLQMRRQVRAYSQKPQLDKVLKQL